MKIIVIMNKLNMSGGGENHDVYMKVRALQERGHDVVFVTMFSEHNNIPKDFSIPVIPEHASGRGVLGLQRYIVAILKKYAAQTDIFYVVSNTFMIGAGWYCMRARRHKRKPVVIDINGYAGFVQDYYKKEPLYPRASTSYEKNMISRIKHAARIVIERTLGVYLVNHIDSIIMISRATASYYIHAGVHEHKITVILGFHDIEALQKIPLQHNPFVGSTPGIRHILCTGRLHIDKGFDLLLDAVARLKGSAIMVHIIGDGPEKDRLMTQVAALQIGSMVTFYPWCRPDELVAFYQHADLFAYPGRLPDVMVRVTVEAMACGLPLILPDGSAEDWEALGVAKVFSNGDSVDLSQKIRAALEDSLFQKNASRTGVQKAKDFDYRTLAVSLEKLLLSQI
jgi:glycosyltransferase involved in cell wall biosynthesis